MGEKIKRIVNVLLYLYESILEIIYPHENYCIICGKEECEGICKKCINSISKTGNDEFIDSYGYYSGVLKKLIIKFKFHSDFTAGEILADILGEYIVSNYNIEDYIITYVPLTKKSEKNRGFNQCKYISKRISKKTGIRCIELIVKTKETKEQKLLSKTERIKNIQGVFKLNKNILSITKGIIVIDDVVTTGATLMEIHKVFYENGIKNIKLLTLARSTI